MSAGRLPELEAKSIVLVYPRTADGLTQLFMASPPFALAVAPPAEDPVLVFAFDQSLRELGLGPGPRSLLPGDPRRSPLPPPIARLEWRDGVLLKSDTATAAGLELPPLEVSAILARGDCLRPGGLVTSACGPTTDFGTFQAEAPLRPVLTSTGGACAPGWVRSTLTVDRGPALGALEQVYCQPPPRLSCGADQRQAAADERCQPLGGACPSGAFAEGLPGGAVYVSAGAVGGDGSLERPFGALAEVPATAAIIALGRGSYREDLHLSGPVQLIGACAAETELQGSLLLSGHQGSIRGLRVRAQGGPALEVSGASSSTVSDVALSGPDLTVIGGSRLYVQGSKLGGAAGVRARVIASRLHLEDSELTGSLRVSGSTLSVQGCALTATSASARVSASRSLVRIDGSRLGLPLATTDADAVLRRSWVELVGFSAEHPRSSVNMTGGRLSVEACTLATLELLVPTPEVAGQVTNDQVAILLRNVRAQIEDTLIIQPSLRGKANVSAIAVNGPTPAEAQRVARVMVVGGTQQSQLALAGRFEIRDLSIYQAKGAGLQFSGGDLQLTRFEAARFDQGLYFSAFEPVEAEVVDVRVGDAVSAGIEVRSQGASLNINLRRVVVESGPSDAIGVELRTNAPGQTPSALTHAKISGLLVRGPLLASLQLGMDAYVDIEDFSASGAGLGLVFLHRPDDRLLPSPHHLRLGEIEATLAAVEPPEVPIDLERLLDQVRVRAPKVLGR